jgi:hypothetical protein
MNPSAAAAARLTAFPDALRELLAQELTAGNSITEVGSSFPAPPVGAYVKLINPVTTRARSSGNGLVFYDRNSSIYSGEWTDAQRYFFVLEPPRPPEPELDMEAIRAAHNPPSRLPTSGGRSFDETTNSPQGQPRADVGAPESSSIPAAWAANSCVRRFQKSMVIDYEKWHDGIGYDLSVLEAANEAELAMIEDLLLRRRSADWRDVEALAAIGSERAKAELRRAFAEGNAEIRGAVLEHAPDLVSESHKTEHIVEALRTAEFYYGLSQAIDEAAEFHPAPVVAQLFRSALTREGGVAVHCAALLLFIHGWAESKFDWEHRPFLLRFNTKDPEEREAVFRELCERIGVDPDTVR